MVLVWISFSSSQLFFLFISLVLAFFLCLYLHLIHNVLCMRSPLSLIILFREHFLHKTADHWHVVKYLKEEDAGRKYDFSRKVFMLLCECVYFGVGNDGN